MLIEFSLFVNHPDGVSCVKYSDRQSCDGKITLQKRIAVLQSFLKFISQLRWIIQMNPELNNHNDAHHLPSNAYAPQDNLEL